MPQDKDFKRIVRQRMAETGERYTVARAALAPTMRTPPPSHDRIERWLELLATREHALGALDLLRALPPDDCRRAALRGLTSDDWRVRRGCCQLLDDLVLTEESIAALQAALDDGNPEVRRAALHSLSCQHCKPDGCSLDVPTLYERMASDPSRRVRSVVAGTLSWTYEGAWAVALLERFSADPSPQLRAFAAHGLARIAAQDQADAARRQLPDALRAKTERHPGKWVAIADGKIIGAERGRGSLRPVIKGNRANDAQIYWVAPR
jgi:hypothetical protein